MHMNDSWDPSDDYSAILPIGIVQMHGLSYRCVLVLCTRIVYPKYFDVMPTEACDDYLLQ